MSKLKRLINQLSNDEYQIIHKSLVQSEALKSAELLSYFKNGDVSDDQIKERLEVNNNAFYTLRSRLNEKIESFFLEQLESPQTTLLKQVASINEILLTKTKTIAIATLNKLERELKDYDLSNELTLVYKALKKLHINSPEFYVYSQLYNRHVAYMLATDKSEDMLSDYFKKYAQQLLNYDDSQNLALSLTKDELMNNKNLYTSHRLQVYYVLCFLFHNIIVDQEYDLKKNEIEVINFFDEIEDILGTYHLDPTYYNLKTVVKYLRMLFHYKLEEFDEVDRLLVELNNVIGALVNNFSLYTCPVFFFQVKLERYRKKGWLKKLKDENQKLIKNLDVNNYEVMNYISVTTFLAQSHYYIGEVKKAIKVLHSLSEEVNLKQHLKLYIDVKLLQAMYCLRAKEIEEVNAIINNVQRQIRLMGKEHCLHSYCFLKVLKSYLTEIDETKRERKIVTAISQFQECETPFNSPLSVIDITVFQPGKASVFNEEKVMS